MTEPKTPVPVQNHHAVAHDEESTANVLAINALRPAVNSAMLIHTFAGKEVSLDKLVDGLNASMNRSKAGDLSTLEKMLIGQATALETIFVNLALRAEGQASQRNMEALLLLALRAQSQSRATIAAVVDLKFPRQPMILQQNNVAHANQQVNNGVPTGPERSAQARPRGEENPNLQSKQMELNDGQRLDTGATGSPIGTDPHLATLGKGDRTEKRRR